MSSHGSSPGDPRLDPFRKAVWELSRDDRIEAYLVTDVTHFRSLPFGRQRHEWLWCKVCWLDGRQEPSEEDYGPEWFIVSALEGGHFESSGGHGGLFRATPVESARVDELWEHYGPP